MGRSTADDRDVIKKAIDLSKISGVVMANVDMKDYPDFCDAYIEEAHYDGVLMNDDALDVLNEEFPDFVQEKALESV